MSDLSIENICCYCMSQIKGGFDVCPKCGHVRGSWEQPEEALPVETILGGRYLLGRTLGIGGFGITYLGRDLKEGGLVAVKEYVPSGLVKREDPERGRYGLVVVRDKNYRIFREGVKDYLEEGHILAMFRGVPNIVAVKSYFTENKTAYLVLEYIEGETLTAFLKDRESPVPPDEAVGLLQPVLQSLSKVHDQDIIHRDISPDNIMLGKEENRAILIDFGAAVNFVKEQKQNCIMLKPGYAPPEQYSESGAQGPWTDIYALCATLYRMITGNIPSGGDKRMKGQELPSPSSLGIEIEPILEEILEKGMEVQTGNRYQSIPELYQDLERYAAARHQLSEEEKLVSQLLAELEPMSEGKNAGERDVDAAGGLNFAGGNRDASGGQNFAGGNRKASGGQNFAGGNQDASGGLNSGGGIQDASEGADSANGNQAEMESAASDEEQKGWKQAFWKHADRLLCVMIAMAILVGIIVLTTIFA